MKRRLNTVCSWLLITLAGLWFAVGMAYAEPPVVHAALFYSQTCPHCHKVITEDLPLLVEQHGDQLLILAVNTSTQQGLAIYQAAVDQYQIPADRRGVPMLIVGDTALIGSLEIPQQFPGIIENGLVAGGIDWPDIPGFRDLLEAEGLITPGSSTSDTESLAQLPVKPSVGINPNLDTFGEEESLREATGQGEKQIGITSDLEEAALASENMTLTQRFAQDKSGNTLSVVVLLGMVFSVAGVGHVIKHPDEKPAPLPNWIVPVLVLIGTTVALYMGYVEITQTEAVCGPVGDCNTVQQSSYAFLFGVIPIGAFGVMGYMAIGLTWLIMSSGPVAWRKASTLILWLLALFGILFSIYLTFLEPFVIGATCAWCLTSAIIMALLLWVTTPPVIHTWFADGINGRLFGGGR